MLSERNQTHEGAERPVILIWVLGRLGRLVCEINSSNLTPLICVHSSDSVLYLNWKFTWKNSGEAARYEKSCLGGTDPLPRTQVCRRELCMGLAEYVDRRALTPPGTLTASHYISCKNEVCVVTGLLWRAARGGVQSAMWTQMSQSPARERRGRGRAWAPS